MNEHEDQARIEQSPRRLPVLRGRDSRPGPRRSDVVVDLSGMEKLDVTSLALLLTARQHAEKEHRAIWLAGVPMGVWKTLHAMGLGGFFKPFPETSKAAV
jgi:ABC-type transporter Mla MlaB component